METFTLSELVSFGEYLLSKERKKMIQKKPIKGGLSERLSKVSDADIANWKDLKKETINKEKSFDVSELERQKRAYLSAINRGKVNDKTTEDDLLLALQKEVSELFISKSKGDSIYVEERTYTLLSTKNTKVILIPEINDKFFNVYTNNIAGTKTDELADIVIICHTFAEFLGVDLEKAVNQKMMYNELRTDNIKTT